MASQLQSDRTTAEPRAMDMKKDAGSGAKPPRSGSGRRAKGDELITRNLRMVYDEIAAEPLPPELAALLSKLEDQEDKSS